MKEKSFLIIRHRKENLKKCSLRGLEKRNDVRFFSYPERTAGGLPPLDSHILLDMNGEELSSSDPPRFILIDATWRYATRMLACIKELENCPRRRLPDGWKTAYPRCQTECSDPERGLASIEALYVASLIVGTDCPDLLDGYYWKEIFLERNRELLASLM